MGSYDGDEAPSLLEQTRWSRLGWEGLAQAQGFTDVHGCVSSPCGGPSALGS